MTHIPLKSIEEQIVEWFTYHPPTPEKVEQYELIRSAACYLAQIIAINTPRCADQTAALRKLRECVMTANAAIACKGV